MPDYGIAALAGLLGGAGKGFEEGLGKGTEDAQKAALLAEQTRHNMATEQGQQMPLAQFYNILGMKPAPGVDTSGQIPVAAAGHAFATVGHQQATQEDLARRGRVAGALTAPGLQAAPPGPPGLDDTVPPPPPTEDAKQRDLMSRLLQAGATKDELGALESQLYPKPFNVPADTTAINPHTYEPVAVGAPRTGTPRDKAMAIMQGMAGELDANGQPVWTPGTPAYQREYGRRYAGTTVVPEHGGVRSNYDVLSGSSPKADQVANPPAQTKQPGLENGELAYTPGKAGGPDIEKGAAMLTSIAGFRGLADDIDKLAPDVKAKARLWIMKSLQDQTPISFLQFLTPQEAAATANLSHLQVRYQQAMGGLRGSGSPENYKVYYNLMGNAANGQEATQLRAISDQLETQYSNENAVRGSQRMRPFPPVSSAVTPPPAASYGNSTSAPGKGWGKAQQVKP